jgi:ribosomal protein S18 acetylase RimI-like enzyme
LISLYVAAANKNNAGVVNNMGNLLSASGDTTDEIGIRRAGIRDIAPVFNLITSASQQGNFSSRYLEPAYRAGLAKQLFSVLFLGRIRLPDGRRYRAKLRVIRDQGSCAGFLLMRQAAPTEHEIYMCAVDPHYRKQGLASALVQEVISCAPAGTTITAECLPASAPMKNLLLASGFHKIRPPANSAALPTEAFSYLA